MESELSHLSITQTLLCLFPDYFVAIGWWWNLCVFKLKQINPSSWHIWIHAEPQQTRLHLFFKDKTQVYNLSLYFTPHQWHKYETMRFQKF